MVSSGVVLLSSVFTDHGAEAAEASGLFLFLSVLMISIFSFVSIAVWTEARRKEREAYYKTESLRRIAEMPGDGAKYMIEMMREEERNRRAESRAKEIKHIEGMKVGGLVNIGVGLGLMIFLYFLNGNNVRGSGSVYLVGLIPGLIGVSLLTYTLFFAPRPPLE